jgi:hypothetical protein
MVTHDPDEHELRERTCDRLVEFSKAWSLAQPIADCSRHTFGNCALMIEAGRTARHSQSDRCFWREIVLPGEACCFPYQFREAAYSERTETDEDATGRAQMKVGKVEVSQGPLKLRSSGFVISVGRRHGRRRQTQSMQLSGDEGFKTRCGDSKKSEHGQISSISIV